MDRDTRFRSFEEFYHFYLSEHRHPVSRQLHVTGISVSVCLLFAALVWRSGWLVLFAFVQGYALAWIGHFFFEHNRPATFRHPLWSFAGDWRMWWESIRGRLPP